MSKFNVFVIAAMSMTAAISAPYWTIVTTDGANGDKSGDFNSYTAAYFCTKEAAGQMFEGNDTTASITQYLATDESNYVNGMLALASGGTALSPYTYDDDQYSFVRYVQMELSGEYLAVLAYTDPLNTSLAMVRVFDAVADDMGCLTFDPAEDEGSAGNWTTVPEPTGGLLCLLGIAVLALKRGRT